MATEAATLDGLRPEPDQAPEPEEEGGEETGSYSILESADGIVWTVVGHSSGGRGADGALRAYFEPEARAESVNLQHQYVAVHRSSFKPQRPKRRPAIAWSPVE